MANHGNSNSGLPNAHPLDACGFCLRYGYPPPSDLGLTRHVAARQLGYFGGIRKGGIKAIAARINGLLGGRPPGS